MPAHPALRRVEALEAESFNVPLRDVAEPVVLTVDQASRVAELARGYGGDGYPVTVEPSPVGGGLVVARCRPFVWCIDRNGEVA